MPFSHCSCILTAFLLIIMQTICTHKHQLVPTHMHTPLTLFSSRFFSDWQSIREVCDGKREWGKKREEGKGDISPWESLLLSEWLERGMRGRWREKNLSLSLLPWGQSSSNGRKQVIHLLLYRSFFCFYHHLCRRPTGGEQIAQHHLYRLIIKML